MGRNLAGVENLAGMQFGRLTVLDFVVLNRHRSDVTRQVPVRTNEGCSRPKGAELEE